MWYQTGEVISECNSNSLDRFGFCGDAAASETYNVVCQKVAFSATVAEVLLYNVNVTAIPTNGTALNGCTDDQKPVATFPCAKRDCEVVRADVTGGNCFSFTGLTCGKAYKPVRGRCFSVTLGTYINDPQDWSGPCEGLSPFEMQDCDPAQDGFPLCTPGNVWQYGPWSACGNAAGKLSCSSCVTYPDGTCVLPGNRTREASCVTVDSDGNIQGEVDAALCAGAPEASETCAKECPQILLYYVDAWPTTCKATCACPGDANAANQPMCKGNARTGVRTRTVVDCGNPDNASDPNCADSSLLVNVFDVPASTMPCETEDGPVCDACTLPNGKPYCTPANTNGTCATFANHPICNCLPGYEGSRCHVKSGGAAGASLIASDGSLCPGVLSLTDGTCCHSGLIDATGSCCQGLNAALDACGLCAVPGVVHVGLDRKGKCCGSDSFPQPAPLAFLDGKLECCAGPHEMDDCGVCGGDSSTCGKRIDATLDTTPGFAVTAVDSYLGKQCGQGAKLQVLDVNGRATKNISANETLLGVSPPPPTPPSPPPPTPPPPSPPPANATSPSSTPAARRLLATTTRTYYLQPGADIILQSPQFAGDLVVAGQSAQRAGVLAATPAIPMASVISQPGNGVCETGEVPATSGGDCLVTILCEAPKGAGAVGDPTKPCGGNGICNLATGFCTCNAGYVDTDCGSCDVIGGFADFPSAQGFPICSKLGTDYPPIVRQSPPADQKKSSKSSGLSAGAIAGIVIAAVVVVGAIGVAVFLVIRRRAAKTIKPAAEQ